MSKKGERPGLNSPATHITQIKDGSVVMGNMRSEDSIRVDGHINGDLISKEKIIIGANGHIGGTLNGAEITVEGFVNGNIVSSGLLQVSAAAKISGNIYAKEIAIEKGAEMNGKVNVGEDVDIPGVNSSSTSKGLKTNVNLRFNKNKGDQGHDKFGKAAW